MAKTVILSTPIGRRIFYERKMVERQAGVMTPVEDLLAICFLAGHSKGNVLEIGCSKVHTAAVLALRNPDKLVYAVDS